MEIGHRAKLAEAIRSAQDDIRRQLAPSVTSSNISAHLNAEAAKRAHLSVIDYDSFETIDLEMEKPVERDPLIGREWIEQHLDYTRRYRITQAEIESAADFRRQNTKECVAPGARHTETIMIIPDEKNLDESLDETESIQDENLDPHPVGRESPKPHDMNDDRIVDYTLNPRLFPVPLFPNHQHADEKNEFRYARISIPKNSLLPDYKPKIQNKPINTEDSLCLWDHCVKGYSKPSGFIPKSKTKNKLDLRSHLNPFEAVDVYKIQSGQSFKLGKGDPFDISKVNFEEKI